MESLSDIFKKKTPEIPKEASKRVTQEFQSYGLYLAEKLNDQAHKGIYIRLAKTRNRGQLEAALSFVIDSRARNMGALFMWKLKQLKVKK
jgi:hypothetical protein